MPKHPSRAPRGESKLAAMLAESPGRSRPISERVSAEQYAAIEADLKAIAAHGKCRPSYTRIAEYLQEEYGVQVGHTTVQTWLRRLEGGK